MFREPIQETTTEMPIVPNSPMYQELKTKSADELKQLRPEDLAALAEDLTEVMQATNDREGIHGGSMDGTRHMKYEDKEGNTWMAKGYPAERLHRALADEFVSGMAGKLGLSTRMEAKTGVIDGEFRVLVKWAETTGSLWDELDGNWDNPTSFVEKLTETEILQIAQEQVLDWLTSNHDPHLGHFLRREEGGFVCIDKAQAFKYIGDRDEELSTEYNPNGPINGFHNLNYKPAYNVVLPRVANGKCAVSIDQCWEAVQKVIDKVEAVDDNEYAESIEPYAAFRFDVIDSREDERRGVDRKKFMKLAVDRKKKHSSSF